MKRFDFFGVCLLKNLIKILINLIKTKKKLFNYILKILLVLIIVKHDLKIYHEYN
jgi:hypothetical protein